jgi:hypothetical protein
MELKDFENRNLIFESVWKTIASTTISGLFVFIAFVTNMKVEKPIAFWGTIGLFGFGLLRGLYKLLNPKNLFLRPGSELAKEYGKLDFERRLNDNGIFEYSQNGFKVDLENQFHEYQWTDISVLFGYKKDLYTIDNICLDVFTIDGKGFTINEDTAGWYQFIRHSKENLTAIPENWEMKIASPAFETKLTLLYDKNDRSQDEVIEEIYGKE